MLTKYDPSLSRLPKGLDDRQAIGQLLKNTMVQPSHSELLNRLNAISPNLTWQIVAEDYADEMEQIFTRNGDLVAQNRHQWVEEKECEWGAVDTWQHGQERGLLSVHMELKQLTLAARIGVDGEDFVQLYVCVTQGMDCYELFQPYSVTGSSGATDLFENGRKTKLPATPVDSYSLFDIVDVKKQLEAIETEHRLHWESKRSFRHTELFEADGGALDTNCRVATEWPYTESRERRFFNDWGKTCGRYGQAIEQHWWLAFWENKNYQRKTEWGFIPQWADGDGGLTLPVINQKLLKKGRGAVLQALSSFDGETGYDFSWYFYMLHGDRVHATVGMFVVDLIRMGYCPLSNQSQQDVLLEWASQPYRF